MSLTGKRTLFYSIWGYFLILEQDMGGETLLDQVHGLFEVLIPKEIVYHFILLPPFSNALISVTIELQILKSQLQIVRN